MNFIVDMLMMVDGYHRFTNPKHLKAKVEESARFLEEKKIDFDTIAVQGISGLTLGSPLAIELNKNLMVIRKPGEKTQIPQLPVFGLDKNQKILLIDDCIDTGATVRNMISKIKTYCRNPTLVGLFLYTGKSPITKVYPYGDGQIDVFRFPPSTN